MGASTAAEPPHPDTSIQAINLFLMTPSFETGGSERQFAIMARNVDRARFHTEIGCIRRLGPFAADFPDASEFRLGGSLYGLKSLATRLQLSKRLRRNRIQVAHSFDFYTNMTLIPAAHLARVPVIIGSHRQVGDLMTPLQFRAQASAFRGCDAVVCNSQAGANSLVAAGVPRQKLVVIGNALLDTAFQPTSPALPRQPGLLRVCMVARMNADYKNHRGFLRIAAEVLRRLPNVEFLLVGDGPLRSQLERYASELGVAAAVRFLGERFDIPAILASSDVAILTSESEGLSNVILEAMAARLPVVAYNAGGNIELVDDSRGFLIPLHNESEFANAMERLLSDSALRQKLGMNALRFVEENYSVALVCRRYESLYSSLLAEKLKKERSS